MSQEDLLLPINACVIIPTYNNHKTLKRVIDGVLAQTAHIIVVNDGATDGTDKILELYPDMRIIHLPKNKGKGNALRVGFREADRQGYDYAITIDSDGQHYPADLPVFVNEIKKDGEALLIGARNMGQDDVPKKSSFGNRFSNFWFWFETGIRLQDTQCGYRLYPLKALRGIRFYTTKFEFEIEVIVKTAWRGIVVKNVPVNVLYDPEERVSHFRPFRDFARISILNTWLVLVSLVYIRPRDYYRSFQQKGFKQFFFEDLLRSDDSKLKKSLSVSLGVFVGISPVWGFHTVSVLFLAYLFRLNKLIAFAFSNISIPPMIPLVIYGSLKTGALLMGSRLHHPFQWDNLETYWLAAQQHLTQYIAGSLVLGFCLAIIFGIGSYLLLHTSTAKSKSTH